MKGLNPFTGHPHITTQGPEHVVQVSTALVGAAVALEHAAERVRAAYRLMGNDGFSDAPAHIDALAKQYVELAKILTDRGER